MDGVKDVAATKPPSRIETIIVGAFGGVFPTLLRTAIALTANPRNNPVILISNYIWPLVGLAIFATLGAGVAYIWQETDRKKIFYVGIGLPALVTVAASGATPSQQFSSWRVPGVDLLLAQDLSNRVPDAVMFTLPDELREALVTAAFQDAKANIIKSASVSSDVPIAIPHGATAVSLTTRTADSDPIRLPNTSGTVAGRVSIKKNPLYGLWVVFGVQAKPSTLTIGELSELPEQGRITGVLSPYNVNATVKLTGPALIQPRTRETTTGVWSFDGVPPGQYEVTISVPGYRTLIWKGISLVSRLQIEDDSVGLFSGDANNSVDLTFPTAMVKGRLLASDGRPIAAIVEINSGSIGTSRRADSSGAFEIPVLIDASFNECLFTAQAEGYVTQVRDLKCKANTVNVVNVKLSRGQGVDYPGK